MRSLAVVMSLLLASCSGQKKQGELGADCYPNGTCNVTLACVGGLCVAQTADASVPDANVDGAPDARSDAVLDAPPDARVDAPPDAYCDASQTNIPDGHHNAALTCLQAGCHLIGNTGAGAPEYSYAGTLFSDATGNTGLAGATIEVTAGGQTHKLVTASNGNFFIPKALADAPTNAVPASALASACPQTAMMVGQLVDGGGNCNNCHRSGGTTAPIHLP